MNRRARITWSLAFAALVATAGFAETEVERFLFGPVRSASMVRAPGQIDRAARVVEMESLRQQLAAEAVGSALSRPLVVELSAERVAEVAGGAAERRYRVGLNEPVGEAMSLAHLAGQDLRRFVVALPFGDLRGAPDGGFVWTGAVRSPGATALRLHLTDFDLSRGTELFVYNRAGQAFGPYAGAGPLGDREVWTNTVFGDEMILQLVHRGPAAAADFERASFVVADLGYLTERFLVPGAGVSRLGREGALTPDSFCDYNAECVENLSCSNAPAAVDTAADAIADMLFASGRYYYICTGGLVADSAGSMTPYFLTANHCISKGREASSLETYFDYVTSCGDTTCAAPFDENPRNPDTLGSSIVAGNRTGDFTLLQLAGSAPDGSVFLGWSTAAVAFADGTHLYRVSHPAGAPQAYSEHDVDTSKGTCTSWPRGSWIYSQDVHGATEGGSSGSPVLAILDGEAKIVGQLSGGCGTDVYNTCNSVDNATVDGAFASYFSQVEQYLDPQGGGCVPVPEICGNEIDDDCDGDIDEGCPGACTPAGQSCLNDSDCCSNNCSNGKPSSRVCLN